MEEKKGRKPYRHHGEGSVRERADGTWEARARFDGRVRSFYSSKPGAKGRKEALAKLTEAQRLHVQGRLPDSGSKTVAHYLEQWLEDIQHTIRPQTLRSYRLNVDRVKPYLGKVRLDQLKPAQVQNCYTKLLEGLSKRSVQQCGTVLHKALQDALRLGLVSHNAADLAQKPRPEETERPTLTADQLMHLFEVTAGDRYHALWVVLGTMGLRLGEALGLKWVDIDLEGRTLTVSRALQRQAGRGIVPVAPKSKASRRTLDLLDMTVDALLRHQERQTFEKKTAGDLYEDQGLVFAGASGSPPEEGGIHRHWKKALDRAGLPYVRRHDLRHTAATLRLRAGANMKVVQQVMGHNKVQTTLNFYGHVQPGMQREAADQLEAFLSPQTS